MADSFERQFRQQLVDAGMGQDLIDNLWASTVAASDAHAAAVRDAALAQHQPSAPPSIPTPSSTSSTTASLDDLAKAFASATLSSENSKLKLPPLEKFDGSADQVLRFIASVRRHIYTEPAKHKDVGRSILWALEAFTGEAERWAATKSELIIGGGNPWNNLDEFYDTLKLEFASLTRQLEAQANLRKIKLEKDERLDTFVRRFKTEAEDSGWNDDALIATFRARIPKTTQISILTLNGGVEPTTIDVWYAKSQVLARVHSSADSNALTPTATSIPSRPSHSAPRASGSSATSSLLAPITTGTTTTSTSAPDAMDVDAHQKRRPRTITCFNCGETGHKAYQCRQPARARAAQFDDAEVMQLHALLSKGTAAKDESNFPSLQQ